MSETPTPASAGEKAKKVRKKKAKFVLRFGSGPEVMEARAQENADGTFTSFVRHVVKGADGKRDKAASKGRGETKSHTSLEDAKKAVEKIGAQLQSLGWSPRRGGGGGGQVKDSFDFNSLPKPPKAPKK